MMSSSTSTTDNHNGALAKRNSGNGGAFTGLLSSWMSYFTGRQYDNNAQEMFARNEQMMARMEQLMNKLEEKLEKLESLEDRGNNRLERKALPDGIEGLSSGDGHSDGSENLGTGYSDDADEASICSEDLKGMGESLQAYQDMVAANRTNWTYSANDYMTSDPNLDDDEELNVLHCLGSIKKSTIKMRRGEYHSKPGKVMGGYPAEYDFQGIRLDPHEDEYEDMIPYHSTLKPHWKEFVEALDDFDLILDIMPDDAEPCFQISQIELPFKICKMIMKSLEGKSFLHYKFINNDFGRNGILSVIDLMDSNEHLQSLTLSKNLIDEEDEGDFCEAIVNHPALSTIYLEQCWEERTFILCELVRSNQLVEISMRHNDLRFVSLEERQAFTDALVTNTTLEKLDLTEINLNDEDLACFATVLAVNSTLKFLCLTGSHRFTELAKANFGDVLRTNNTLRHLVGVKGAGDNGLFDDSSLNSAADSNHTCYVERFYLEYNLEGDPKGNRQRKIYNILARRHMEMCNVQYFDDIDTNLLPEILAAVQRCAVDPPFGSGDIYEANRKVNKLSIMFEIMRKWDKALSLYKTFGDNI